MATTHRGRSRLLAGCLIYVAALSVQAAPRSARADSAPKVVKGPYLQALASTSVEVRAELDIASPISIQVTGVSDAGAPRTVRDDSSTAMHVVRIDGLLPATRYSYSLTIGHLAGAKGAFTTAPPNDSKAPFSFLVYGDNRTDDTAHAVIVRAMLGMPSDFIVNTGDLVQDGASDPNWQSFFDVEAPLIRDRNVFACVGNHELTEGAGANYLRYFGPTADAHGDVAKPKLYGSLRWGNTRIFLLDAMETFDSGPERTWLDDELARADAEPGLVWRIVVMHHSPWSAGPHGGNARALHASVPALFAQHHVDLVIAGHDHIYERGFAPISERAGLAADAPSGIRYLISGGGGAPLYTVDHPLPSTRKVESVHHVAELTVESDAIRLVATRDDGSVIERCGMVKAHPGWDCDPPPPPLASPGAVPSPSAPSASRWGCNAGARRGSPNVAPALAGLGLIALRRRRRRNVR
jgi:MYXO-CTERM domain-containing protein